MDYLEGRRADFDLPLDLTGLTVFQRLVLLAVVGVPRGKVATYAEIARKIDRPRAARAVGQALRRNPIPIVIPCHRVLASDGGLGGYTGRGGLRTKKQLLSLEGVRLGAA
jgi:O-6-methylguanine DNA methyltransferase